MEGTEGILSRVTTPFGLWRTKGSTQTEESERAATRAEILTALQETAQRLAAIRSCFDCETDFDMIDSYILELDALEKRYSYLIKRAKQEQIRAF